MRQKGRRVSDLDAQLRQRLDGQNASREQLDRLWWELFDESFTTRQGRDVFLSTARFLETGEAGPADLGFRLGGWEIDLGKAAVQAGLVSAFLGGVLAVMGVDQVPVEVLPAVIPLVFDIRRCRLTASQEKVLAELTVNPEVRDATLTADQLYAQLPDKTQADLSRLDFEDFIDAFRRAGVADVADDEVTVRPVEQSRLRITFR